MAKFKIEWTTETWHSVEVDASSTKNAENIFWENPALCHERATVIGSGFMQDSLDVTEVLDA